MSGELTPQQRDMRLSNAEREGVVARLNAAAGEGRITLDEFQERVDGVLRAQTYGEIAPYVADLPAGPIGAAAPPREVAEIRSTATSLRRRGRWSVPRRLLVHSKAGSVKLDFTEAVITTSVVDVVLDVVAGSTTLVLPGGASVDADEVHMIAGGLRVRGVPGQSDAAPGPHFVVSGQQKAGSLTIRHQRRFWRWRW